MFAVRPPEENPVRSSTNIEASKTWSEKLLIACHGPGKAHGVEVMLRRAAFLRNLRVCQALRGEERSPLLVGFNFCAPKSIVETFERFTARLMKGATLIELGTSLGTLDPFEKRPLNRKPVWQILHPPRHEHEVILLAGDHLDLKETPHKSLHRASRVRLSLAVQMQVPDENQKQNERRKS